MRGNCIINDLTSSFFHHERFTLIFFLVSYQYTNASLITVKFGNYKNFGGFWEGFGNQADINKNINKEKNWINDNKFQCQLQVVTGQSYPSKTDLNLNKNQQKK